MADLARQRPFFLTRSRILAQIRICTGWPLATHPLAVGQTLVGRLSDLFGRSWFLIPGSCLAFIGCIVCAVAKSITTVIGGTVMISVAASTQLNPNPKRRMYNPFNKATVCVLATVAISSSAIL